MKAQIKNFQSISDSSFDLDGFTVITGPSNRGKSALLRALGGAMFGIPGDYYIKTGESLCTVGLSDNGSDQFGIQWERPKNGSATLNILHEGRGNHYSKLGKNHQSVTEKLGFREIKLKDIKLRPQIAKQGEPDFLLSLSENVIAEVLKSLGRVDVVAEAQRITKVDSRQVETKLKIREEDITGVKKETDSLTMVPVLRSNFDNVSQQVNTLDKNTVNLQNLISKIQQLEEIPTHLIPKSVEVSIPNAYFIFTKINQLLQTTPITIPDQIKDPTTSEVWLESWGQRSAILSVELLDKDIKDLQQEQVFCDRYEEAFIEEKKKLEDELGICPTCGKQFSDTGC